ncbi:MAG: zeta toxin family protein [Christensenellales bacterium]
MDLKKCVNIVKNNFIAYNYLESYQALLSLFKQQATVGFELVMIVGANGSGKSTYVANLRNNTDFDLKYINADMVAKESVCDFENEEQRNYSAMFDTMNIVDDYIMKGYSFIYETVLSHESKIEIAKKAKEKGYKIYTIYIETDNVQINIERVKRRAIQGGHNVSEQKIIERYERVKSNVEKLKDLSNEFYVFNNSIDKN